MQRRGRVRREFFIGQPGVPDAPDMWNAHIVVEVDGWMFDPTLLQAWRPQWPDLPPILAGPVHHDGKLLDGRNPRILGLGDVRNEFVISWFANPAKDEWRHAPDARSQFRATSVRMLIDMARTWRLQLNPKIMKRQPR